MKDLNLSEISGKYKKTRVSGGKMKLDLSSMNIHEKNWNPITVHNLVHNCNLKFIYDAKLIGEHCYQISDMDDRITIITDDGNVNAYHIEGNELYHSNVNNQHEIQKLLEPFWIEEEEDDDVEKRMIPLGQLRREMEEAINRVDKLEEIVMGYQEYPEPEIDLSDGWFNDIERFINSVKVMGTINVCSDGNALKRAISYFTELRDIKQKMRERK